MQDAESYFWTGSLKVGSQGELIDVVFDTSSDWLAFEGSQCESCTGNTYNAAQSETAKQVSKEASERRYNEIRVMGTPWSDKVCIFDQKCIDDFEFFLIESQSFLKEPVDGFLGLGRR